MPLLCFHRGGCVFGEKTGFDPSGLLTDSPEPFIFIAMNDRVSFFPTCPSHR